MVYIRTRLVSVQSPDKTSGRVDSVVNICVLAFVVSLLVALVPCGDVLLLLHFFPGVAVLR